MLVEESKDLIVASLGRIRVARRSSHLLMVSGTVLLSITIIMATYLNMIHQRNGYPLYSMSQDCTELDRKRNNRYPVLLFVCLCAVMVFRSAINLSKVSR
jgi:hypothetical protein